LGSTLTVRYARASARGQIEMPGQPSEELLTQAEAGDAEAQNAVGRFYAESGCDPRSVRAAEAWFRRAADQGLTRAKHNLGVLALRVGQNDVAAAWLKSAAVDGWLPSIFALGGLQEEAGHEEQAAKLYEMAAQRGHAESQDALGRLLFALGTNEGYEKARYWSELAAAQGLASAQTRLGTIYHEGLGVKREPRRAASYFLSAARSGHAGAQLMIGAAYHLGIGVAADRVESAFWLMRSVAQGSDLAAAYLPRVQDELTEDEEAAVEARLREVETARRKSN